jgi:iron complex outermembrane receptor protein
MLDCGCRPCLRARINRQQSMLGTILIAMISSAAVLQPVIAGAEAEMSVEALLDLDLKALTEVEVSLASRKQESRFNAASAVYTLTREDIRRSGLRRIPEILRLVPGLHVERIDNNTWAISSRNKASRYSGTMLVMMDGRVLYNTLTSGVNWDVQNTYIDDIERIEVIRGPGAALWGANAVDGVINIITRSAEQTQGFEV